MVDETEGSDDPTVRPDYARPLIAGSGHAGKRLLHVQAPSQVHIRRICRGRVLDVGAGIGRNLVNLGAQSVGVDRNAVSVDVARSRGLTAYLPADFRTSPDGILASYDTLLFAHVLEHLPGEQAQALLTSYLPYLKPGGATIVICPQERGYASDPTHVTFLDFAGIAEMCRQAGLLVRQQYSFPLPRLTGRVFTHNEFVVLADKARAVLA